MRAAVCTRYGPPDVVEVQEVATPAPKANEVLVRVNATTVASADRRIRASDFPGGFLIPGRLALGLRRPRNPILGTDFAGTIAAVGSAVTGFEKGAKVFGASGARLGCHAEYKILPADGPLVRMPDRLTFEEAAAIPFGGLSALFFLQDLGRVRPGDRVLVNGASGAVGVAAVQIADHLGARVTGVCSTQNVALVESLGARDVVDYTKDDFTRQGKTYDVVFDTVGKTSFAKCRPILAPKGRYLAAVAGLGGFVLMAWTSMMRGKKFLAGIAPERRDQLGFLKGLVEAGTLRPIIDRTYPLHQIVDAHRYVDTGHKRGNVVLRVAPTQTSKLALDT